MKKLDKACVSGWRDYLLMKGVNPFGDNPPFIGGVEYLLTFKTERSIECRIDESVVSMGEGYTYPVRRCFWSMGEGESVEFGYRNGVCFNHLGGASLPPFVRYRIECMKSFMLNSHYHMYLCYSVVGVESKTVLVNTMTTEERAMGKAFHIGSYIRGLSQKLSYQYGRECLTIVE